NRVQHDAIRGVRTLRADAISSEYGGGCYLSHATWKSADREPGPILQTYLYGGKDSTLRIKTTRAAPLGGDDGEEGPPADRPERRVDHPQGHHAENPGDPAATPGPRRVLGRGRVRGVLPPEEERIG